MGKSISDTPTPKDVAEKAAEKQQDEAPKPEKQDEAPKPEKVEQERDWKAYARQWEGRAKDNLARIEELEAKLADAKPADIEARISAIEEQLAKETAEKQRLEIIAKHGIKSDYWHLVSGSSADEWEKAAKDVATLTQARTGEIKESSSGAPSDGSGTVDAGRERFRNRNKRKD